MLRLDRTGLLAALAVALAVAFVVFGGSGSGRSANTGTPQAASQVATPFGAAVEPASATVDTTGAAGQRPDARANDDLQQVDRATATRSELAATTTRSSAPAPSATAVGGELVPVADDLVVRAAPGAGRVVGAVGAASPYLHTPTTMWVERTTTTADGVFGLVTVPYANPQRHGWVRLDGLTGSPVDDVVHVSLGRRTVSLVRDGGVVQTWAAGIGAVGSTTPPGHYWVSDVVPHPGGAYGAYAFGLSNLQPHPPAGWQGPAQLAIHGTNAAWTVGSAASAGCVHLATAALEVLARRVAPGTPVVVTAA